MLSLVCALCMIYTENDMVIPASVESMFQVKEHPQPYLKNLWLLCFLVASVESLIQVADNTVIYSPKKPLDDSSGSISRIVRLLALMESHVNV